MERGFNRSLAIDMFDTARITERIVEGQVASDKAQAESTMRLGYMGHLTLIAEEVVKFTERVPPETFSPLVLERVASQAWTHYVEKTLAETRERDNAILGGVRPDASLGPRQAVMNAVNAAQGFGSLNSLAGLGGLSNVTGNPNLGLDSMELANSNHAPPAANSLFFSGSVLMSGFSHGSSDEDDEDMDEADDRLHHNILDESDQVGELPFDDTDMSY
jgi:SIT4-associating protein SAP185/190